MRRPAPEPGSPQDSLDGLVSYLIGFALGSVLYFLLVVLYYRFIAPWLWKPPKVTLSSTTRSMVIKLGREESVTSMALEHLLTVLAQCLLERVSQRLARGILLAPKPTFGIVGELDVGDWSALEGFKILGQYLRMLSEDIPYTQWEDLTLRLPNQAMYYCMLPSCLFVEPLPPLMNLKTLTWSGHRRQLTDSWMPFTPDLLRSLTTLDITCDITLDDCFYLLLHCENARIFKLQSIARDGGVKSVFGTGVSGGAKTLERPHLQSLTLVSFKDIASLLLPFKFTSLREIDFSLSYDHGESLNSIIPWSSLTKVHLRGMVRREDSEWVREQCPPGADHRHAYVEEVEYKTS